MILDDHLRRLEYLEDGGVHGIGPRQDQESGDEGNQNDGPNTECGSVLGGQSIRGNGATPSYALDAFSPEVFHLTTAGLGR